MAAPMSPPYEEDDLTIEDDEALQADRIVLRQVAGGKRTVSAALLSTPPSGASLSSASSSSSTASVRFHIRSAADRTFDLPVYTISIAAVEFCGFTPQAAYDIYTRYVSRPDPDNNPDSLNDYMQSRISEADNANELSPSQAMNRMGLTQAVRDAIMDSTFAEVRKTQTITFWAHDTVEVNWKTLIRLKSDLKAAANRTRSRKRLKPHVESIFPLQSGSTQQTPTPQFPSHTATVQSTLEGLSFQRTLPMTYVSLVTGPPAELPDHYILYKAKAAVEMEDWIDEEGGVSITGLQSHAGGDFNFGHVAYYWTLERATAEQYHGYAIKRTPHSEIWMIQVQVKKTFINAIRSKDLWYGRDWKEFVWYSRKKLEPPTKYDEYWKPGGADLIRGHICKSDSHVITNIKKQDVQGRMSENNVMVNPDGRKASQWAFAQYDSISRFAREIKGKIHVEITPPLNSHAADATGEGEGPGGQGSGGLVER